MGKISNGVVDFINYTLPVAAGGAVAELGKAAEIISPRWQWVPYLAGGVISFVTVLRDGQARVRLREDEYRSRENSAEKNEYNNYLTETNETTYREA